MQQNEIYNPAFVQSLFDEMSKTYDTVNYFSSFGFSRRWRRQCVERIDITQGMTVMDLMSGMGELWPHIIRRIGSSGSLTAVDFSHEMCERSRKDMERMAGHRVEVIEANILDNSIPDDSADCIVSSFGIKTFSDEQKQLLAREIKRILKPGGIFSLVEISVPSNPLLRLAYIFYLKRIIPMVGKVFLGNPDNYRMLGVYTEEFTDSSGMQRFLRDASLEVESESYFFGCATGVSGRNIQI